MEGMHGNGLICSLPQVVWSDETKNKICVQYVKNHHPEHTIHTQLTHGGGCIMLWGHFYSTWTKKLARVDRKPSRG